MILHRRGKHEAVYDHGNDLIVATLPTVLNPGQLGVAIDQVLNLLFRGHPEDPHSESFAPHPQPRHP